jgi:hypothetical protein
MGLNYYIGISVMYSETKLFRQNQKISVFCSRFSKLCALKIKSGAILFAAANIRTGGGG